MDLGTCCPIVPPYLLEALGRSGVLPDGLAEETLRIDAAIRSRRSRPEVVRAAAGGPRWTVYDAGQGTTLPGRSVRTDGMPPTGDPSVDEAADGTTLTLDVFADAFGRDSFDGAGATVPLVVHYGRSYANAFWDGSHLVFGDGDGEIFGRFTASVDVLAHEFGHAVTERTAGLVYQGQSGALNESISDVFGAVVKQAKLGQDAEQADWLVGAEIFLDSVSARGLRDMANPGTAYDDPRLGRDPQPAHMDDFVHTTDDNGGVHLNSGIPNRAFVLAARGIGGPTAAGAGRIWYTALTSPGLSADATFDTFAAATVEAAGERADVVRAAWEGVGVRPGVRATPAPPTPAPDGPPTDPPPARRVSVRRTGGIAGLVREEAVDLAGDDPRVTELRGLLARRPLRAAPEGDPVPDGYVYTVRADGEEATVPQQGLTADLARIVELVLGHG